MDRGKGEDVLVPAYDDAAGITAAFNLNLLDRINRELGGTIPVDAFRHRAIWNETLTRIEMHLEATRNRSEEHTSELQSLMRISYAVFCLKKKKKSTL